LSDPVFIILRRLAALLDLVKLTKIVRNQNLLGSYRHIEGSL